MYVYLYVYAHVHEQYIHILNILEQQHTSMCVRMCMLTVCVQYDVQ